MQVKINGKGEEILEPNLLALLKSKNIEPQMVSVELNGTLLTRTSLADTSVKEGDQIEFLYFMGGGAPTGAGGQTASVGWGGNAGVVARMKSLIMRTARGRHSGNVSAGI